MHISGFCFKWMMHFLNGILRPLSNNLAWRFATKEWMPHSLKQITDEKTVVALNNWVGVMFKHVFSGENCMLMFVRHLLHTSWRCRDHKPANAALLEVNMIFCQSKVPFFSCLLSENATLKQTPPYRLSGQNRIPFISDVIIAGSTQYFIATNGVL